MFNSLPKNEAMRLLRQQQRQQQQQQCMQHHCWQPQQNCQHHGQRPVPGHATTNGWSTCHIQQQQQLQPQQLQQQQAVGLPGQHMGQPCCCSSSSSRYVDGSWTLGSRMWQPVLVTVSGGFTISSLNISSSEGSSTPPETLVTQIIKVSRGSSHC
jgi:hypothetical protein